MTKLELQLYSLLYLKFGKKEFGLDSVRWYFSKPMLKKLAFGLGEKGWVKKIRKGIYACVSPNRVIFGLFEPKVESILAKSKLSYCFSKATAAEIWSGESFVQRSWEYSPFFIKVLKKDLNKWASFLKSKNANFFVNAPSNAVGEFVVLVPVSSLKIDFFNGKPVEPLNETVEFCEKNKDSFEYVLAYVQNKFGKKTTASKELLVKSREAL
ncbi:MAG: hypothetical protein HYW50_04075 [Candidatus Diapherotrites archaeon]|nr:hypothetical protein [Candidatus Diapherotrites archaeon]